MSRPPRSSLVERVGTCPVTEARYVPTICDGNVELAGEDLERLHVDLSDARGGDRVAEIERRIRWAPVGTYEKHLITGHTGSGKSSELQRLSRDLMQTKDGRSFHVLFFDVKQHLDPTDIQLPELVAALFSALWRDPLFDLPTQAVAKHLGKEIIGWFRDAGIEVSSNLTEGIPLVGALLKSPGVQRLFREKSFDHTARTIEQLADVIQAARTTLVTTQGIDDLVIVIDNLEKMLLRDLGAGRTNQDLLFVEQLPKLEALPVHLIITFPVSLHADRQLRAAYANATTIQIPMVRVHPRGSREDDTGGMTALRAFLDKRLDRASVFATVETMDEAIRASGGCVRDLLRIVSMAVVEKGTLPIDVADVKSAVGRLVADMERVLQGRSCVPHLRSIEKTSSFPTEISQADRRWLLQDLIVLEYNGETWYDVHPLVRKTRAYQESTAPEPS